MFGLPVMSEPAADFSGDSGAATFTWTTAGGVGDQKITNAWNATTGLAGQADTATNASYNRSTAPGANTPFGFHGAYAAAYPE